MYYSAYYSAVCFLMKSPAGAQGPTALNVPYLIFTDFHPLQADTFLRPPIHLYDLVRTLYFCFDASPFIALDAFPFPAVNVLLYPGPITWISIPPIFFLFFLFSFFHFAVIFFFPAFGFDTFTLGRLALKTSFETGFTSGCGCGCGCGVGAGVGVESIGSFGLALL